MMYCTFDLTARSKVHTVCTVREFTAVLHTTHAELNTQLTMGRHARPFTRRMAMDGVQVG